MTLYFIKEGKLHLLEGNKTRELPDGIYDGYVRRTEANARRKEWKHSGEGAKFTGAFEPTEAPSLPYSHIRSVGEHDGIIYYSEQIDEISGIYKKLHPDDTSEKVGISANDCSFLAFDIKNDKMAVSVGGAMGAHIGVCSMPSLDIKMVTEGDSHDTEPCFSLVRENTVYFSSRGIARREEEDEFARGKKALTPLDIMRLMGEIASKAELGPSAVCRIDLNTYKLDTVVEHEGYDCIKPACAADGSLYYIKKPYETEKASNSLGCFVDAILMPFRLLLALFGFLNLFSMKYSGKTLSGTSTKAKHKSERELFIDGNLINAERELKANSKDKNPGIIPRTYELHRIDKKGNDTLIKRGVLCYTIDRTGNVICSNGRHILCIDSQGNETVLAKEDCVTFLKELDIQ